MIHTHCLTEEYVVYSLYDEAIDKDKSNTDLYGSTLDPKHLVFVDGKEPTKFIIRPMTVKEVAGFHSWLAGLNKETITASDLLEQNLRILNTMIVRTENPSDLKLEELRSSYTDLLIELGNYCGVINTAPLSVSQ